MFNVKISLLYFLLVALVVTTIHVIVQQEKDEANLQAEKVMERAPAVFAVRTELREKQMLDFARRLAEGELKYHVQTLHEFREDFIEVDKYICSEDTGVKCDLPIRYDEKRAKIAEDAYGDSTFAPFSRKLAKHVKLFHPEWQGEDEQRYTAEARKRLQQCFGRASKRCDWRFTYDALLQAFGSAKEDLEGQGKAEQVPDVALVYDARGIGIASVDDDGWSDSKEHVGMVERLRQYVNSRPVHRSTPVYYDLLKLQGLGETEYLVAMVPLVSSKGRFLGAVLVGYSVTGKIVETEKRIFDKEITYILGDKPVATTMSSGQFKFLLGSVHVTERLKKHIVTNDDWVAVSIPYFAFSTRMPRAEGAGSPTFVGGAAYGSKYQRLRVVLATPRDLWTGSYAKLQMLVPVFGLVIFLMGVILFSLLIRNHTKPFEKIDAGIHEVINGNFDYQFPFDYREDLPSSMAQSLNLMIAVLLGKPLPEDDAEAAGSWGDGAVGGPSGARVRPRSEGEGDLIILKSASPEPLTADEARESAESYYKRLYAEYRKARTDAGDPDDVITYVRFVEQLVRAERELKTALGVGAVRFRVKTQGKKVTLEPAPGS